jgi:hypothetical protein
MDKEHITQRTSPGYETRDANVGAVYNFLVIMAIILVLTGLVCWGVFHYFSAHMVDPAATDSPFANSRQLPLGPQLQVNPREDLLNFREGQEKSLHVYAWQNRTAGTVQVPIELAMELLVKKGVPVQGAPPAQPPGAAVKPSPEGSAKR